MEDAVAAKRAFEQCARERGVAVKHCHADNGTFKSAAFLKEVTKHQQTISFCGVDAHHQNGTAEHRIRVLSDTARIQSLHAMTHDPKCVEPHLWPYALKHANHMFNLFPREGKDMSPEQLFSKSAVDPNIDDAFRHLRRTIIGW